MRFDPHGDQDGYHRKSKHKFWKYTNYVIRPEDIQPYWILCERSKSFLSNGIIFCETYEGKRAWLSHTGQVIPKDGKLVVSESSFPSHKYTPIEDYFEEQEKGKCRLTWVRLSPSLWPSDKIKKESEAECLNYHLSREGMAYPPINLGPMALVSFFRNTFPFLKHTKWKEFIPPEALDEARVCSAEVACGWSWAEYALVKVLFPASLSMVFPSPQDIFDSPHTQFMGGYIKEYKEKK